MKSAMPDPARRMAGFGGPELDRRQGADHCERGDGTLLPLNTVGEMEEVLAL